MKRLLCIISSMNAGGAETFLMKIYRRIDKKKYQFDFCVNTDDQCFYDNEIKKMGGNIFHITPKSKSPKQFKRQLYEVVKNNNYKYVLRITSNAAGFWDLKIAKDAGAKCCIARSSNSSDGKSVLIKLIHLISRTIFKRYVDVQLAPSDLAAKYTFGKNEVKRKNVYFLNNALDLDVFRYREDARTEMRKKLNIENKFVIGHVGRFNEQKNHVFLIKIFREVLKIREDSVLLLVGDGILKNKIMKIVDEMEIEDKVFFLGIRSDVNIILSAMDTFVLPSFYEGMPNVVIEAQSTGLPCFISDSITKEVAITNLINFVSLTSNPKTWADKIAKSHNSDRTSYSYLMSEKGYDISEVTEYFTNIIFSK